MQNTVKQNYPGSVTSYDTRPRNEMGIFYNVLDPTQGQRAPPPETTAVGSFI